MSLKQKVYDRMDILQNWMEENYHLKRPEVVYEHTLTISKFWSILSEEDRDYLQCAQDAIENGSEWRIN